MPETAEPCPETEPHPFRILEVGTLNYNGQSEAGLRPSQLPQGSQILTVDLRMRYAGLDPKLAGTIQPADPESRRTSYDRAASRDRINGFEIPDYSQQYIKADGRWLPFDQEQFDRVVMNDVIGDPMIEEKDIILLVEEALRVLKVGGELWVFDDRAIGKNLGILARCFPVVTKSDGACYVRNELLSFQDPSKIREEIELYDRLCTMVNSHDPHFTVFTKVSSWTSHEAEANKAAAMAVDIQPILPNKPKNPFSRWFSRRRT